MKRQTIWGARFAATLLLLLASEVRAQTCETIAEHDSLAAGVLSMVRSYTAPADPGAEAHRISLGYPLVHVNQVTLVTKEQDCKKARDAFRAATTQGSGWTNRVVVVKAGQTYTVIDPGYVFNSAAPRMVYVLLDSQFRFKNFIGG